MNTIIKTAATTAIILILLIFCTLFLIVQCQELTLNRAEKAGKWVGSLVKVSDK